MNRRMMHLFINIPARDIDILSRIPFSMNTDLQLFLAPYPEDPVFTSSTSAPTSVPTPTPIPTSVPTSVPTSTPAPASTQPGKNEIGKEIGFIT